MNFLNAMLRYQSIFNDSAHGMPLLFTIWRRGSTIHRLGFTNERQGFTNERCGFANKRRSFTNKRSGFINERRGIIIERLVSTIGLPQLCIHCYQLFSMLRTVWLFLHCEYRLLFTSAYYFSTMRNYPRIRQPASRKSLVIHARWLDEEEVGGA